MKTNLLRVLPYLALAGSLPAQQPPPPLTLPPTVTENVVVLEEKSGGQTVTVRISGGPLDQCVDQVQDALRQAKMEPLNVLIPALNDNPVMVPPLSLRNVTGPDALLFIATAAGMELKPVQSLDQGKIIGWEFQKRWSRGGGTASPNVPPSPVANAFPTPPPLVATVEVTPPPVSPPPSSEAVLETPGGTRPLPGLSSLPIVGGVFTATAPAITSQPATVVTNFAAIQENARDTRVYALGTVTGYASFEDVENTLRGMLDADGFKGGDVKLAFHDKTNVLVANGSPRAHQLIEQLVQALSRDAAAHSQQEQLSETRNLKDDLERRVTALKQTEAELQDLRKQAAEAEAARMKAEMELKLLKDRHSPGQ